MTSNLQLSVITSLRQTHGDLRGEIVVCNHIDCLTCSRGFLELLDKQTSPPFEQRLLIS
jgi:hypothetical protein